MNYLFFVAVHYNTLLFSKHLFGILLSFFESVILRSVKSFNVLLLFPFYLLLLRSEIFLCQLLNSSKDIHFHWKLIHVLYFMRWNPIKFSYWSIQWYFSSFEYRCIGHMIIINDFQLLHKFIYSQTNSRGLESTFYWLYCIKFVFLDDCVERSLWNFQKSINQSRKIRNFFCTWVATNQTISKSAFLHKIERKFYTDSQRYDLFFN